MTYEKPSLLRRICAYLAAAVTFTAISEIILQIIAIARTGAMFPFDEAHIACLIFTFVFTFIAGFLMLLIGHAILSVVRGPSERVKRRHAVAYAIGYMVFLALGIGCAIYANPDLIGQMRASWWAFALAAVILFICALIAGRVFAQIYDQKPKSGLK